MSPQTRRLHTGSEGGRTVAHGQGAGEVEAGKSFPEIRAAFHFQDYKSAGPSSGETLVKTALSGGILDSS